MGNLQQDIRKTLIKVVFLTSYADFEYAQQAVRLNACDYLLKPVDEGELAKLMAGSMRRRGVRRLLVRLAAIMLKNWHSLPRQRDWLTGRSYLPMMV